MVNTVFRELLHQILGKIKNEPYFKWPNKMGGDPMKRNQSLHCQYHQDQGYTTEDYRTLCDYLEQLVKVGKLNQFLYQPTGQGNQVGSVHPRDASSRPPLGTINVILATPSRTSSYPSRVMSIVRPYVKDLTPNSKPGRVEVRPALSFSDEDKVGTFQLHDDVLVVTLRIGEYDVKKILVDQCSGAKIMYPDLYEGPKLKLEDLVSYNSLLVGFDGKIVILRGQIRLPVQARSEVVEVDFIVVNAYSPYTAIMARPWLHAMRVVSSTLHLKVKYPSGDQVEELVGSQDMARQCLVMAIRHQSKGEYSATTERAL